MFDGKNGKEMNCLAFLLLKWVEIGKTIVK